MLTSMSSSWIERSILRIPYNKKKEDMNKTKKHMPNLSSIFMLSGLIWMLTDGLIFLAVAWKFYTGVQYLYRSSVADEIHQDHLFTKDGEAIDDDVVRKMHQNDEYVAQRNYLKVLYSVSYIVNIFVSIMSTVIIIAFFGRPLVFFKYFTAWVFSVAGIFVNEGNMRKRI